MKLYLQEPKTCLELQQRVPVIEALKKYAGITRFHMPGHRGGAGADDILVSTLGEKCFSHDVTGVPGMDDLHEPHGCIREAQELAAQAFGADHTYFSVNGTSCAIQTMVLACLNDGDTLIIPRNIHKSILSAIILSGARPVFVRPRYNDYFGFALGVTEEDMSRCLEKYPEAKATLLVNPTYYGIAIDLHPIAEAVHRNEGILLVDEAHGPHFHFHPRMPKTALESGADAVAQGAHKILGAFTQASYLHIQGTRLDKARLKAMFQYLTTTSPSYLFMASLDSARRQMAVNGQSLMDHAIDLSWTIRDRVNEIKGLYAFGEEFLGQPGAHYLDPTKVTISVRELGITGYQAEKYLRYSHDIQVEMSDLYNILIIISHGNTLQDAYQLLSGLKCLAEAVGNGVLDKDLNGSHLSIPGLPALPDMVLTPRCAVKSNWESISIDDSPGHISAEVITIYPPGIPILYPGELITKETVDYLKVVRDLAFGISGPADRKLLSLRVVKNR